MDKTPRLGGPPPLPRPRFEQVAVTSVFGDPRNARTWSGAPANVATALERLGVTVRGIHPAMSRTTKLGLAVAGLFGGLGRPRSGEQVLRSLAARRRLAAEVEASAYRLGVRHVLHFGTLDLLPRANVASAVKHYLYCDHTWALARTHHVHARLFTKRAQSVFDDAERQSLDGVAHVFTFGEYVRENLIGYYGLPPERVTAVGSGMGAIEPWHGPKRYDQANLLFVAKHLFQAKGGTLLVEALRLARLRRPDIRLTIVGDERSRSFVGADPSIEFRAHLPWEELQQLYRSATLLVQPMLNDPWGQVYLEAMASRTPVMGLARNGLPELVCNGRHGFLVDRPDPTSLADAIVSALSEPSRLESMGTAAQAHVLGTYSWGRVAEQILFS